MIETSIDLDKIAPALHAAQGLMTGVVKDAKNPHFKNNYATLEAVIDTARPALQAQGLSITQAPAGIVDGSLTITTMLLHASGQWMRSTLHVPLQKRDAQGVGSAISYGRRYALMAVLGLPSVDDDGNEASKPAPAPPQQSRRDAHGPSDPIDDPRSSSERLADDLIAALSERAGKRVTLFLATEQVKQDLGILDRPDFDRVLAFANKRRDVRPDTRAA